MTLNLVRSLSHLLLNLIEPRALESSQLLFARTGVTAMDTRMALDYLLVIMALGLGAYLTVAPLIFPE